MPQFHNCVILNIIMKSGITAKTSQSINFTHVIRKEI